METVKAILRALKALLIVIYMVVTRIAGGSLLFALVVLALLVSWAGWVLYPILKPIILRK